MRYNKIHVYCIFQNKGARVISDLIINGSIRRMSMVGVASEQYCSSTGNRLVNRPTFPWSYISADMVGFV